MTRDNDYGITYTAHDRFSTEDSRKFLIERPKIVTHDLLTNDHKYFTPLPVILIFLSPLTRTLCFNI